MLPVHFYLTISESKIMTTFEELYLIMVIAAFLAFGTTLYMVDRPNRR
jgi:hypothetical protein